MNWANELVVQNEIIRNEKKRNNDFIVLGIYLLQAADFICVVNKLICLDCAANYYSCFSCVPKRLFKYHPSVFLCVFSGYISLDFL